MFWQAVTHNNIGQRLTRLSLPTELYIVFELNNLRAQGWMESLSTGKLVPFYRHCKTDITVATRFNPPLPYLLLVLRTPTHCKHLHF